jgi:hypothetical protein
LCFAPELLMSFLNVIIDLAYRAFALILQGPTQQKPSFELEHEHGGCDVMCERSTGCPKKPENY